MPELSILPPAEELCGQTETGRTAGREAASLGRPPPKAEISASSLLPQVLLLLPDRYNKIVVGADQSFNRMSSVMVGNMATYVRRCWSKAKENK